VGTVIKVLVVDDHPAVRTGIEAVLRAEPGLVPIGSCATLEHARHEIERSRPSVAVVDYELQDGNGLDLCLESARAGQTRTLVYSAYSERVLVAGALLAGADGLLHKSAGADELCDAIRCTARGIRLFPPVTREYSRSARRGWTRRTCPFSACWSKEHRAPTSARCCASSRASFSCGSARWCSACAQPRVRCGDCQALPDALVDRVLAPMFGRIAHAKLRRTMLRRWQ
jgi:DNA-binding NarL/FixJ family response regulator